MSAIREDAHGPYAILNGSVYRPQESRWSYPIRGKVMSSKYKAGMKVPGRHLTQSPHAMIGDEVWNSHGPSPLVLRVEGKPCKDKSWAPKE